MFSWNCLLLGPLPLPSPARTCNHERQIWSFSIQWLSGVWGRGGGTRTIELEETTESAQSSYRGGKRDPERKEHGSAWKTRRGASLLSFESSRLLSSYCVPGTKDTIGIRQGPLPPLRTSQCPRRHRTGKEYTQHDVVHAVTEEGRNHTLWGQLPFVKVWLKNPSHSRIFRQPPTPSSSQSLSPIPGHVPEISSTPQPCMSFLWPLFQIITNWVA